MLYKITLFVCLILLFASETFSQPLKGIKNAIIVINTSEDMRDKEFIPSVSEIQKFIKYDIPDINILSSISVDSIENATIGIEYNIFRNYDNQYEVEYFGAIEIYVDRFIKDDRLQIRLINPKFYTDATYLISSNQTYEELKIDLKRFTKSLIRNLAYYYYQNNS